MKKKVVWIDDNEAKMSSVAESLFVCLWKKSIDSAVILFGDEYKKEEEQSCSDDKECDKFKNMLSDLAGPYKRKNYIPDIEDIERVDLNKENIKEFINKWKFFNFDNSKKKEIESDEILELSNQTKIVLDDLLGKKYISASNDFQVCFALDLVLFFNDISRLLESDLPILSMYIYKYLIDKKQTCFLYTGHSRDQSILIKTWKSVLIKYFNINIESNKIYYRQNTLINKEKSEEMCDYIDSLLIKPNTKD